MPCAKWPRCATWILPRPSRLPVLYHVLEKPGQILAAGLHRFAVRSARRGPVLPRPVRVSDVEDGGTTEDGLFTVEQVMCLAACDRAPMLQCNFHYHENLDMDTIKALIEQWRAQAQQDVAEPGD